MNKRKLSIRVAILIIFIFLVNFSAGKFHWYSSLPWFDMPMHFLGGMWLGLAFIWLLPPNQSSRISILKIILGVLTIGLLWEVYEVLVDGAFSQKPFDLFDTVSDLFFDLAGGMTAVFYFFKRIILQSSNEL